MPAAIFEPMPDKQAARAAAHKGVRRGLVVGIGCAAILGLLVARTFRSPALQDASAQTAGPTAPTPPPPVQATPDPLAAGGAFPVAPPGMAQPNPYASPVNPYANPYASPNAAGLPQQPGMLPAGTPGQTVPAPAPATDPASVPAMVIAAPEPGSRRAAAIEGRPAKPASYTDADLARLRAEETAGAPASEAQPVAESRPTPPTRPAMPPPPRSTGPDDSRTRDRREAVRAAQQRVAEAQATVDDIRREARENDDDGLQEELADALDDLKSAQRDLARARRKLQEAEEENRAVLSPQ